MKIIKKGTIKDGKLTNWVFDCEGGDIDLSELAVLVSKFFVRKKAENNNEHNNSKLQG